MDQKDHPLRKICINKRQESSRKFSVKGSLHIVFRAIYILLTIVYTISIPLEQRCAGVLCLNFIYKRLCSAFREKILQQNSTIITQPCFIILFQACYVFLFTSTAENEKWAFSLRVREPIVSRLLFLRAKSALMFDFVSETRDGTMI
jgi:hypothetical protein